MTDDTLLNPLKTELHFVLVLFIRFFFLFHEVLTICVFTGNDYRYITFYITGDDPYQDRLIASLLFNDEQKETL